MPRDGSYVSLVYSVVVDCTHQKDDYLRVARRTPMRSLVQTSLYGTVRRDEIATTRPCGLWVSQVISQGNTTTAVLYYYSAAFSISPSPRALL
jgi:hypothetical protein